MKVFKYTAWGFLIFLTVFYILPAGVLRVPYIQKKISDKATGYLENKLGTEVHIGKLELEPFNKLILKNVFLCDQSGDTLFTAKRISAGFDLMPLFKSRFRFRSVQLFTFNLRLSRETGYSPLNIQYIIDAFQSDKNKENSSIDLKIKDLNLRLGTLSYRVKDVTPTPGKFNPGDIVLNNVSTKIHLSDFTRNELNVQLNKLGFTEKSGLQLNRLSFELKADSAKAQIAKISLELPNSNLQITDIQADYGQSRAIDSFYLHLSIDPSFLSPKDLCPIVPFFSCYDEDKITCQGKVFGTLNDFVFSDFLLSDKNNLTVRAEGRIQNAGGSRPDSIYIESNIAESSFKSSLIQRFINQKAQGLPKPVQNLGTVFFNGNVTGYVGNLNARGYFKTDIGNLNANITIGKNGDRSPRIIHGEIASPGLDLKQLLENENLGVAVFDIKINAVFDVSDKLSGHIEANVLSFEYKGYNYENVNFLGDFTPSGFKGSLNIEDPNGKLTAHGSFLLNRDNSEFNFSATASNIRPDKLNLMKKYPNPHLSFTLNADFTGNRMDNFLGAIRLKQLLFSTDKGTYNLDDFRIQANMQNHIKEITISSDILTGDVTGVFSLNSLIPEIKQTLSAYLPSLFQLNTDKFWQEENNFSFHLTFNNNENLTDILGLPFTFYAQSFLSGSFNNIKNEFEVDCQIPRFKIAGSIGESGTLKLRNQDDCAQLEIDGTLLQKKDKISLNASFIAAEDAVHSSVSWNKNAQKRHKGKLEFVTRPSNQANQESPAARVDIKQSQIIFNDSVWTLYPTMIIIDSKNIEIRDFTARHADQFVEISGDISHDPEKQLSVKLNEVDLSYIFETLAIKALDFGGIATGEVFAKDVYHTRQLTTNLDVSNFAFNKVIFGHLLLDGSWDNEEQGVKMTGNVVKNDSTGVKIDGMIYPVKEEISILFDAKNADAAFLRKYLDKVVQNFSGKVTGPLRLFGDLNHPTVEGKVGVKDGGFQIGFLNTYYTFNDTVTCAPDRIFINNMTLYDENKNKAVATGYVQHKLFDDFRFSVNLDFEKLMVFNATKASNPAFFGTSYGTGKATLKGTEDLVNINVSLQNTENSKMTLNFMEGNSVAEYKFIRFVNKEKDSVPASAPYLPIVSNKPIFIEDNSGTEIRLTLSLAITPSATVDLIMDAQTDSKISAYGSGHIDIQYGTSTPLKVLGNYKIEKGKYNFSLQQLLTRNFDIGEGSSVSFNGDPYAANLDLNAAYTVSANLRDLDERLFHLSVRNNVPVNCILLLKGPLSHPNISFDLNLPGSTAELTRQVKSYIRTDDMMNRQILYLLVLGRFYTSPEYVKANKLNNDFSFLTSTLSSQLSNLLGGLSDNFQIGTNFHQAYEGEKTSTEVELLLSSTLLNNRLIINGNFGYINNPDNAAVSANNSSLFVGDLDVEYKLTPNGNIRLKGFNHYNYRNYYSISPELTQGIGILFRKDFNHLRDLLKRKKEKKNLLIKADLK